MIIEEITKTSMILMECSSSDEQCSPEAGSDGWNCNPDYCLPDAYGYDCNPDMDSEGGCDPHYDNV